MKKIIILILLGLLFLSCEISPPMESLPIEIPEVITLQGEVLATGYDSGISPKCYLTVIYAEEEKHVIHSKKLLLFILEHDLKGKIIKITYFNIADYDHEVLTMELIGEEK